MRHIEFTEEELKQMAHESVYHEHPIVRQRMQALLLKSQGVLHQEIVKALGISPTTLRSYFDLFLEGRIEALKQLGYKGKRNLLMERKDEIMVKLEADPPVTYKEAQAKIQAVTGLKRSLPQVREFLKNRITRRKVKQIPARADIEVQESFKTETLEPLVEQTQQKKRHLFCVDAAHCV